MVAVQVVWNGTHAEGQALIEAIAHNCQCEFGIMGVRKTTCPPHESFSHSQRWLDGLLVAFHRREDLWREEQMLPREVE